MWDDDARACEVWDFAKWGSDIESYGGVGRVTNKECNSYSGCSSEERLLQEKQIRQQNFVDY